MIQGAKKISELTTTTLNGSEVVPVVQDDGLGNLTTFKVPVSSVGTDTNIYNSNGTLTDSVRSVNLATGKLNFSNGKIIHGTDLSLPYALSVEGFSQSLSGIFGVSSGLTAIVGSDTTGTGISGVTDSGIAILGTAATTGSAGTFRGGAYVETYGVGGSMNASAVFEANSTTKGALLPRMTTTQRDAIGTPATGLEIYNTTTGRKEVYNGTFWQGISMRFLQVLFTQWNPADAQTVAFGQAGGTPQLASLSPAPFEIVMRGNGVIRGCDFTTFTAGVAGTNESWSLYVRHNGTDYLVQTVGSTATTKVFTNTSLNIPYVAGDIVRMIFVNPTWATNPTQVVGGGFLTLQ